MAEESVEEAPTHQTGLENSAGSKELRFEVPAAPLGARKTMNPSNSNTRTRATAALTAFNLGSCLSSVLLGDMNGK